MSIEENKRSCQLEYYYWYKDHGICPRCKKRLPEPGRVYCKICKKLAKAQHQRRDPGFKKQYDYAKKRRDRLKAEGLCTDCGREKAREGFTRCAACAAKRAERSKISKIRARIKKEAMNEIRP